ncbi:DUF4411 family protein [Burkholderia sp. DN3021]|uniref:DUF4411 family protein n=1 Tax=Burkholderia sp. DN3021 TaxID=3410137 RepID=UPI003C7B1234
MIYVFDTSSIRSLQHFYPRVFRSIWDGIEKLVGQRRLISTREVLNEIERQARQCRCIGVGERPSIIVHDAERG